MIYLYQKQLCLCVQSLCVVSGYLIRGSVFHPSPFLLPFSTIPLLLPLPPSSLLQLLHVLSTSLLLTPLHPSSLLGMLHPTSFYSPPLPPLSFLLLPSTSPSPHTNFCDRDVGGTPITPTPSSLPPPQQL